MVADWSYRPVLVLAIAAVLDYSLGDPATWLHPVQVMGWAISHYTHWAKIAVTGPIALRLAGILLGLGVIGLSGLGGWGLVWGAHRIHPLVGLGVESGLLASCFAGRSLRRAAGEVLAPLQAGDIPAARAALGHYVGRDTATLSPAEILRAVLETVTENGTDGVTAPLFYGLLGLLVPTIGSVPLALAYKASSTLDSMVGYRTPPFDHLGWFSARLDDLLTWLPCRLTVATIALLSLRPGHVWRLCQRDAPADPSPNSGWSECAYAAALDVQLGGTNWYQGVPRTKPLLGDPIELITPEKIQQALSLTRRCFLSWVVIATVVFVGQLALR